MKNEKKKLWAKNSQLDQLIEKFTIGNDAELDMQLAEFDVLGSIAHITMLESIELLSTEEFKKLRDALIKIYHDIKAGTFSIEAGVEDIHSQVELILTEILGEIGKKIHSARSRNDQVLLDLRLFTRHQIKTIVESSQELFNTLITLSERFKKYGMPGYTHTQAAMPSSFGLWFGAFAESLVDDIIQFHSAYTVVNKNPLGSGAGYGSSLPINRTLTTELLGFEDLNYNSIYAQIGRGKSERVVSQAVSSLAETIGKLSTDIILFMSQNFDFISFPDNVTTGSSIMPHKNNPDVFEILRSKCNRIKTLPNEIMMITTNLMTGYHRDLQIIKESFLPALNEIIECIRVLNYTIENITVRRDILDEQKYIYCFSVEAVNQLVQNGIPFRDAYRKVAEDIKDGLFTKTHQVEYSHEGSINNLCNMQIISSMETIISKFDFFKVEDAYSKLIKDIP
jgi:argininosuccinate lyase